MAQERFNIPIFIPQAGCPFQCVFCNQSRIASTPCIPDPEEIHLVIRQRLATIPPTAKIQIAFFGGSFTGLPSAIQENYLKIASSYIDSGRVSSVRISTRPDFIDQENLSLLKKHRVESIELGAQSLDDEVLRLSGRGHTAADVMEASGMILSHGFSLGLQMMIGLPGDTRLKARKTAMKIVEAGADHTRIYPSLVIRGTRMEKWYAQKKYQPLELYEAAEWTADLLEIFERGNVKVLRVGLHPSEGLMNGDDLAAGPFHVSFRELALTALWRKRLENIVFDNDKKIEIRVPPGQINYAIGYRSANRNHLLRYHSFVTFKTDTALRGREFYVDYH